MAGRTGKIKIKRTKKPRKRGAAKRLARKIRVNRRRAVAGLRARKNRGIRIKRRKKSSRGGVSKRPRRKIRVKRGRVPQKSRNNRLRILVVLTADGTREVPINNSAQASLLGRYWNAVQRFLQRGDASVLERFKNKRIATADGQHIQLITDPEQLNKLGRAGVLSFESLYAGVSR